MSKNEFLYELRINLAGLPAAEIAKSVDFYAEMLEDKIESGMSEADAVACLGAPDRVAKRILSEIPLAKLVKERIKPKRRLCLWEIILIVLGAPLWISFGAVTFAVVISVYAVLWSLAAVAFATVVSFAAGCILGIVSFPFYFATANVGGAIFLLGCGCVCGGIAIFGLLGSIKFTRGMATLSKSILLLIKRAFVGKGDM